MIIRQAVNDDRDAVVSLGRKLFLYSAISEFADFDNDCAMDSFDLVMNSGVIFVAESDGNVIGQISGTLSPLWFNKNAIVATELSWVIKEEYQGGAAGIKLLRAFESWAASNGAMAVCMSDLVIDGEKPTEELFIRLGYKHIERSHIKRI